MIFGYDITISDKTPFVKCAKIKSQGGWITPEKCLYRVNSGIGINELLLIGFTGEGLPPVFDVVEREFPNQIKDINK